MTTPYTADAEFEFYIQGKTVVTQFKPIMGKRFCLFEEKKTPENIYGVISQIEDLPFKIQLKNLTDYQIFHEVLLSDEPEKYFSALNSLYLQGNYKELIHCLYHKKFEIRRAAFTLLCHGFDVNAQTISFFKAAFRKQNPIATIFLPAGSEKFYIKHLERDFIRWLTKMFHEIGANEIWNSISEKEISIAELASQAPLEEDNEDNQNLEYEFPSDHTFSQINKWLKEISNTQSTIISNNIATKAEKVYDLRNKWKSSPSKIKTSHKFIQRLMEKWDNQLQSDFIKAFEMFFSGLEKHHQQIYFLFCCGSDEPMTQSIGFHFVTQIQPITTQDIFKSRKVSQSYVRSIIQSQVYVKNNEISNNSKVILHHFENLLTQLKEVDDIFIPNDKDTPAEWAYTLPASAAMKLKKVHYKTSEYIKNYHFEVKQPQVRYYPYTKEDPASAHQIMSITGIAIDTIEPRAKLCPNPQPLEPWELSYHSQFKACSKFDRRYFKPSKPKRKEKKAMTLDDIFNAEQQEKAEEEQLSLDQIFGKDEDS